MIEGNPEGSEPTGDAAPRPSDLPFSIAGRSHEEPLPISASGASALEQQPESYPGPDETEESPSALETPVEAAPDLTAVEHQLLDQALAYAGDSLEDRAYVAALAPDNSELVQAIQQEVLALPLERQERLAILADLSRRPDNDAAWQGAFESARHIGTFHHMGEQVHALEQLAGTQTSIERLDQIMDAGLDIPEDYSQARIMRAVIAQRLKAGDDGGVTIGTLGMHYDPLDEATLDQAYEAALALVAVNLRRENMEYSPQVARLVDSFYGPFKAWGKVVVAKYADPETAGPSWEQAAGSLGEAWHEFTPRQRIAITQELREAGQLALAADLAQHISRPLHLPTDQEHQTGMDILLDNVQALHAADPLAGQQLLDRITLQAANLTEYTGQALSQLTADAPHYQDSMRIYRNAQRTFVQANAHRAAILAGSDVEAARLLASALQPTGENTPLRDEYYATVARGFAVAGHITDAIACAEQISGSSEPVMHGNHIRSRVLTDIARAIRHRPTDSQL